MIKDNAIASKIATFMIEYSQKLNGSLIQVQDACSEEEFRAYRRAVAKVLGEMLVEIMNPLYAAHPELKPEGWDSE